MMKGLEYRIFKELGFLTCKRENLREYVTCLKISEELSDGKGIVFSSMQLAQNREIRSTYKSYMEPFIKKIFLT